MENLTRQIFCQSDLLDTVQNAGTYSDCKTFVDKPLKTSPDKVLEAFQSLPDNLSDKEIQSFVNEYFSEEGHELEEWTPTDYVDRPGTLMIIQDEALRSFAFDINKKWKLLSRKMIPDVGERPDRYSLIALPEPFIIPGGRFREVYYWDSYWVVKGLLVSEMSKTVKGMLTNMLSLVDRYGFVPNGGRIYYLNRSQPPFLIPMVGDYLSHTDDLEFVEANIHLLEKEYHYWLEKHSVYVTFNGTTHSAFRYKADTDSPRPESYREDETDGLSIPQESLRRFYADNSSAAESGWDFSSRWSHPKKPAEKMTSISTQDVIPVDLNSIIGWNARILAAMFKRLGNVEKSDFYKKEFDRIQNVIKWLFWDETDGAWYDFNLITMDRNRRFYASVISPLFTGCVSGDDQEKIRKVNRVLDYVKKVLPDLETYKAGIPTSLINSGQQWDFPNAWPPLQHMWVQAFHTQKCDRAKQFAKKLATRWVLSNWRAWKDGGHMFEKYNAVTGAAGDGGEYEVQVGFGWTNGVILDLLATFPDMSSSDDDI